MFAANEIEPPWHAIRCKDASERKPVATGWVIETLDGDEVFEMLGGSEAQARLTAAAPELLHALRRIRQWRAPHDDVLTVTDGSRTALRDAFAILERIVPGL